jgi:hypothetical protein
MPAHKQRKSCHISEKCNEHAGRVPLTVFFFPLLRTVSEKRRFIQAVIIVNVNLKTVCEQCKRKENTNALISSFTPSRRPGTEPKARRQIRALRPQQKPLHPPGFCELPFAFPDALPCAPFLLAHACTSPQ